MVTLLWRAACVGLSCLVAFSSGSSVSGAVELSLSLVSYSQPNDYLYNGVARCDLSLLPNASCDLAFVFCLTPHQ